jgi:UDP-glucose 4-epimerase
VSASSVAVYGFGAKMRPPVTEEECPSPNSEYAACKLWGEHLGRWYNQQYEMQIVSLRICASMGYGRLNRPSAANGLIPSDRPLERLFVTLPELAAMGEEVCMPPDYQAFDVLHAMDTAQAWTLALEADSHRHDVYNLCGERRTMGELGRVILECVPEARIEVGSTPLPLPQIMSNNRIVSELGFAPVYTLERTIATYVDEVVAWRDRQV